jgi:hypothetical protein
MPVSLRRFFCPNKPERFEQELDGTNLSAAKLEMVLNRRWSNKYTVEVMSPLHVFALSHHRPRCDPTGSRSILLAFFLRTTLLAVTAEAGAIVNFYSLCRY